MVAVAAESFRGLGRWVATVAVAVLVSGVLTPAYADGASLGGRRIYIDPGHGGSDGGACYFGVCEKTVVLVIALKLRDMLQAEGAVVRMSRTTDATVSLGDRANDANAWGAERFVSIHANACGNCGGHGTETYVYATGGTSNDLAAKIQPQVVAQLGTTNRGVKTASFAVLKNTNMPAVLVETAFMDYASENDLLISDAGRCRTALGILFGIELHFGVAAHSAASCAPPPPPPPAPLSVTLQSPAEGTWTANTVRVAATTNQEGSLDWVRILVDGAVAKWITPSPHQWTWDSAGYGTGAHTIKVEARATSGQLASAQATVNVDRSPPGSRMDRPAPGHAYVNDVDADLSSAVGVPPMVVGPLTILAAAWDDGIGIDRMLLYAGADLVSEDHDAPFAWLWTAPAPGPYELTAVAVDGVGNTASWTQAVQVAV